MLDQCYLTGYFEKSLDSRANFMEAFSHNVFKIVTYLRTFVSASKEQGKSTQKKKKEVET